MSRSVVGVAIESDEEGRRAAKAIIADVASGKPAAADEFVALYSGDDALWVGRHLGRLLDEAIGRTTPPERDRLVEFKRVIVENVRVHRAGAEVAKAERAAERRAATSAAEQEAPQIGERMTGVGPLGLPLPDDVVADGDFLVTRVASPDGLMAFYIEHLRADGWTLDLDHSNPVMTTGTSVLLPSCYFTRSDRVGRYVWILTAPGVDDPDVTRLRIVEDED